MIAKLLKQWINRKMCKCSSPTYFVKNGILTCINCDKPVTWDVNKQGDNKGAV